MAEVEAPNNNNGSRQGERDQAEARIDERIFNGQHRVALYGQTLDDALNRPEYLRRFATNNKVIKSVMMSLGRRGAIVTADSQEHRERYMILGETLSRLEGLEEIHVRINTSFAYLEITLILDKLSSKEKFLRKLHIDSAGDVTMDEQQAQDLGVAIARHRTIRHFGSRGGSFDSNHNPILTSMIALPKLDFVNIRFLPTIDAYLLRVILSNPHLRLFNMSGYGLLGAPHLEAINKGFESRTKPLRVSFHDIATTPELTETYVNMMLLHNEMVNNVSMTFPSHSSDVDQGRFCRALRDGLASTDCRTRRVHVAFWDDDIRRMRGLTNTGQDRNQSSGATIITGMESNTSVQCFTINHFEWNDEFGNAARNALSRNKTLKCLSLRPKSLDDDKWRQAMPFLGANEAIEVLSIGFPHIYEISLSPEVCVETGRQLARNAKSKLESLVFERNLASFSPEDYLRCIESVRPNTRLEHFGFAGDKSTAESKIELNDDEYEALVATARRNYGLTSYDGIKRIEDAQMGDLEAIGRLNRAGRRYLGEADPSKEKGVDVLVEVSDDLDALFVHLLENPELCNGSGKKKRASEVALHPLEIPSGFESQDVTQHTASRSRKSKGSLLQSTPRKRPRRGSS